MEPIAITLLRVLAEHRTLAWCINTLAMFQEKEQNNCVCANVLKSIVETRDTVAYVIGENKHVAQQPRAPSSPFEAAIMEPQSEPQSQKPRLRPCDELGVGFPR